MAKVTTHLTERTLSALRPGDSLSGRINKIVDRYLEITAQDCERLRNWFGVNEWAILLRACAHAMDTDFPSGIREFRDLLAISLPDGSPIQARIDGMQFGDLAILVELLETDLLAQREERRLANL